MVLSLSAVIRHNLGWCPRAQGYLQPEHLPGNSIPVTADAGRDIPVRRYNRSDQYRFRTLIFAIVMTVVGGTLLVSSGGDPSSLFAKGLAGAAVLFLLDAVRYWTLFDDVAREGIVNEPAWQKRMVILYLVIILSLVITGCAILVFIGMVPGIDMRSFNAFLAGFGIVGWLQLLLVTAWEHGNNTRLYTDGTFIYRTEGH